MTIETDVATKIEQSTNKSHIIPHDEWLADGFENTPNNFQLRAVSCLEHLITNYYTSNQPPRILEVGPVSILPPKLAASHKPPITLLSERHPDFKCFAVGPQKLSPKKKKNLLGSVEYISALLAPFPNFDKDSELLLKKLGGNPDIIYGQHVFENSDFLPTTFFIDPFDIFEKSANILAPDGFIVVDNYGGNQKQVAIDNQEHSIKMTLVYRYMYKPNEGIYVFKKDSQTDIKKM